MELFGRRKVYTDFDVIDESNLRQAVGEACAVHAANQREIKYLFDYFRGKQPILCRNKTVRPDITYNTVVNRAAEIVKFKVSYLLGEPITYVSRKSGTALTDNINQINDYMYLAGKHATDKELADDFTICGVAYRFVYPNKQDGGAPFVVSTLNPLTTFVAYRRSSSKDSEPVFAATYVDKRGIGRVYDVYTADWHYTMQKREIAREKNEIGMIPIIEYVNDEFRIGEFERVIDLLNDLNALESNRIEATEQNVQSLTWFNDIDLEDEQKDALKSKPSAFIFTKSVNNSVNPDIKPIVINLQQADQQVLTNDLYKTILSIVGMPSTGDGNTSDSSNNGSTIVRNGWYQAEARAKDVETLWKRSDKRFLTAALRICNVLDGFSLSAEDVMSKFTRRNYEDIMTKTTVLTTLLGSDKVDPRVAYQISDIMPDPEEGYKAGMKWYEKQKEEAARIAAQQNATNNRQTGGDAA